MGRRSPYDQPDEKVQGYDASQWLGGIGAGAASGAATGSVFGPVGTAVGGIGGALLGALQTSQEEAAYKAAQEQQNALNKQLASRDVYDRMLQQQGLQTAGAREEAGLQARQAAARGGLTPGAAAALEAQTQTDVAGALAAQRPSMFLAAQQADLARRNQVLQEFSTAQQLANNSQPEDWSEALGGLTKAAALYGSMNKGTSVPGEVPAGTTSQPSELGATQGTQAARYAAGAVGGAGVTDAMLLPTAGLAGLAGAAVATPGTPAATPEPAGSLPPETGVAAAPSPVAGASPTRIAPRKAAPVMGPVAPPTGVAPPATGADGQAFSTMENFSQQTTPAKNFSENPTPEINFSEQPTSPRIDNFYQPDIQTFLQAPLPPGMDYSSFNDEQLGQLGVAPETLSAAREPDVKKKADALLSVVGTQEQSQMKLRDTHRLAQTPTPQMAAQAFASDQQAQHEQDVQFLLSSPTGVSDYNAYLQTSGMTDSPDVLRNYLQMRVAQTFYGGR